MEVKKLGNIVNTFGLKGQLKVSLSSSNPDIRFKVGNKITIKEDRNKERVFTIASYFLKNSRIAIISLEGLDDINDVEYLIGKDIYQEVEAPEGTYFYDDLVDLDVYSSDNTLVGKVTNVVKMPTGDYLLIDKYYVPFDEKLFIKKVDLENKTITLTDLGSETCK